MDSLLDINKLPQKGNKRRKESNFVRKFQKENWCNKG